MLFEKECPNCNKSMVDISVLYKMNSFWKKSINRYTKCKNCQCCLELKRTGIFYFIAVLQPIFFDFFIQIILFMLIFHFSNHIALALLGVFSIDILIYSLLLLIPIEKVDEDKCIEERN